MSCCIGDCARRNSLLNIQLMGYVIKIRGLMKYYYNLYMQKSLTIPNKRKQICQENESHRMKLQNGKKSLSEKRKKN